MYNIYYYQRNKKFIFLININIKRIFNYINNIMVDKLGYSSYKEIILSLKFDQSRFLAVASPFS